MSAFLITNRDGMTVVSFAQPELTNNQLIANIGVELTELIASGNAKWLLLSFQGVTFLTSEMLGQLALLKRKSVAAKISLKICNLCEGLLRVLKLVRLDTLFEMVANETEALKSFQRESSPDGTKTLELNADSLITASKYRSAAEGGNAEAQYQLGRCYENGWGVEQDAPQALKWYGKAIRQNHAEAQNALAHCYAYGIGVNQDYNEAIQLYRQAAEQGLASAQYVMGLSFEFGIGVDANTDTAARWYRLAAYQGDFRAKEALAELG